MFRLLLLGLAAFLIKISAPILELELTWLQAIVITVLAQTFALMFTGTQSVNIGVIRTKGDDEE